MEEQAAGEPFAAMTTGGHEELIFWRDRATGLRAVVAIHDTTLGPGLGGTRWHPYPSEAEAIADALRLSRAMTYKNAAAQLDFGGGKGVVIGDPRAKSEALLRAYGRFIESLGGRYITSTDVGTITADLDVIRRETAFVAGVSPALGGGGDTSLLTGVTVYAGMRAAAEAVWGTPSLRGRVVLAQGAGKVGWQLMTHLKADGATLLVADVDAGRVAAAVDAFGARAVALDEVINTPCDVFSPNALGHVITAETVDRLRCRIICGGANNQLADDYLAEALAERGILCAPDFIVNAGGVISLAEEMAGFNAERARARAERVYETTRRVLERARGAGITPVAAANQLAEERIRVLGALRQSYLPGRGGGRQ